MTLRNYEDAVERIQTTGQIDLVELKKLKYDDLDELVEEIKKWCVYANGNITKFNKNSEKRKKNN